MCLYSILTELRKTVALNVMADIIFETFKTLGRSTFLTLHLFDKRRNIIECNYILDYAQNQLVKAKTLYYYYTFIFRYK